MRPLDHGAGVVYGVIGAVSGGTASLARVFESSCCLKKSAKKLWSFKGQRGFLSHPAGTGRRWTNPGKCHYYLAMPKASRVRCASTRAPFSGRSAYAVSPEWVTSALQADKISVAAAKQEYVRCARNLQRNLQNLERISLERPPGFMSQRRRAPESLTRSSTSGWSMAEPFGFATNSWLLKVRLAWGKHSSY